MNMNHNTVSQWEKNRGYLGNCRSLLQEIVWMIDNWDNSIRMYHVTRKEDEITNCENALMKVKEMIWSSCLAMFSKYNPQTKQRRGSQGALMYNQPELTDTRKVSRNTEVLVHGKNDIPVAVHQREETHTMVVSNSPHQQIAKNLLFEWSVFINSNFQLCLVGTMPNCGTWETSAVSIRLGPTTVKTVGGTIYNVTGKMIVLDEDIPDFVQKKFANGFPVDWKAVANKWISMLKNETCGQSGPRKIAENAGLDPYVVVSDIRKTVAVAPSQVPQQKNKMLVPLQREVERNHVSTPISRGSPVLRPAQNQQDESSDEEEEPEGRNAVKNVDSVLPRFSKRLLSKSVMDTTNLSDTDNSVKEKTNDGKFKYIKNWTVEFFKQHKLILCGTLIDEKGNTLDECHNSAAIAHRVHADVVETEKGHLYRLVGPSASRRREFDFGFPVHWQKLKTSPPHKKALMAPAPKRSRDTSQSSVTSMEVKRHTSMVNHTLKHQLTRAQSSMAEVINNGTLNNRIASKRAKDSASHPRNGTAMKKRKVFSSDSDQMGMNQNDLVANASVDEIRWKQDLIKRMQGKETGKTAERKADAVEVSSQRKVAQKEPEASAKPKNPKPVRKSLSDEKYGHATDGCQSENEFNIF